MGVKVIFNCAIVRSTNAMFQVKPYLEYSDKKIEPEDLPKKLEEFMNQVEAAERCLETPVCDCVSLSATATILNIYDGIRTTEVKPMTIKNQRNIFLD
jgi:hypothetical protein